MRSFANSIASMATLLAVCSLPVAGQQPSRALTLEDLSRVDESSRTPVGKKTDGGNAGQARLAGAITRPKDGVQHPDLDRAWEEYEAAVSKAAEGIRSAIAKQFHAATEKGDLDSAEKWQAAEEQFERAGALPTATAMKIPVNAAVSEYRKARDDLVKAYDTVVKALTVGKDIPAAKKVREESALLKTDKAANPTVEPPIGRRRLQGLLFASGDDTYVLYVNEKLIASGGQEVKPVFIAVGLGDVITVKTTNASYERGFLALLAFEKDRKQIATNSSTWKSYVPKDPARWFAVAGITDAKAAVRGHPNYVARSLAKVVTADAEPIWGSESHEVAYLSLTVEESSFIPLQAVPALRSRP